MATMGHEQRATHGTQEKGMRRGGGKTVIVDDVFIIRHLRNDLERSEAGKTCWGIPSSGLSLVVGSPE